VWATRTWSDSLRSSSRRQGRAGRDLQPACRPQPRGELQVSAVMVGTRLRARTRARTAGAPVMSDASTQTEMATKQTSVQGAACSECPGASSGALVRACTRSRQDEELIHQVAELQETVKRLPSIRGAELEIVTRLQNHAPVETTNENEAPWTLVTRKSRTALQPPSSSITTKTKYEALTTIDPQEQNLQEKSTPAAGTIKRNDRYSWWVTPC